ncbi:MAG: hypothetical protein H6624_16350 [Bdellovibrionaceae bacterium]|nr:hypothetical protein [Bdellovibrionales bacterium]MCB9085918.1 hypothetical protein [Pseudobdellovibrionaceae bacterium]
MKVLILFAVVLSAGSVFAKTLETRCIKNDCFRFGWMTTEPSTDYQLTCTCTDGDCMNVGWESADNRNSTFSVECKVGGCFTKGWKSVQNDNGMVLIDIVTCKSDSCLTHGWDIAASYGPGGEVICKNSDCHQFGGISFWRGKISETFCINSNCYRSGWVAEIDE